MDYFLHKPQSITINIDTTHVCIVKSIASLQSGPREMAMEGSGDNLEKMLSYDTALFLQFSEAIIGLITGNILFAQTGLSTIRGYSTM